MQPFLAALMTEASAWLSTAMAFGSDVALSHRGPSPSRGRLTAGQKRRQVGPYELRELIAAGAMGKVYRARDLRSGRVRAIKLLSARAGEMQRRQFENEILFGERHRHPNQVAVHDHGEAPDGTLYFSMDLLEGVTLESLVEREGAQPPRRVLAILLQVAAALAEVHDHGFVHRDIKPSNILVCRGPDGSDWAMLLDFGLVKQLGEPRSTSPSDDQVIGTPLYISPEALTAPDAVDGRTDLYGLGAVAHFLLSGAPVFAGRSVVEVCAHHLLTLPRPVSEVALGAVSSDLERLVLDCLAKDPAERPATAQEFIKRLESCPEATLVSAPRSRASGVSCNKDRPVVRARRCAGTSRGGLRAASCCANDC